MCHAWWSYLYQVLWKHQQVQNLKCNTQTTMWHHKLLPFLFRKKSNLEIDTHTHRILEMNIEIKITINTLLNHMHITFLKISKYIHNFNTIPIPKMNTHRKKITLFLNLWKKKVTHSCAGANHTQDTLQIIHLHT